MFFTAAEIEPAHALNLLGTVLRTHTVVKGIFLGAGQPAGDGVKIKGLPAARQILRTDMLVQFQVAQEILVRKFFFQMPFRILAAKLGLHRHAAFQVHVHDIIHLGAQGALQNQLFQLLHRQIFRIHIGQDLFGFQHFHHGGRGADPAGFPIRHQPQIFHADAGLAFPETVHQLPRRKEIQETLAFTLVHQTAGHQVDRVVDRHPLNQLFL